MALTTVARAKRYPALANVNSTLLGEILDGATELIENYCKRNFESAERTELYDGQGDDIIFLRSIPITDLGDVIITDANDDTTTIDAANFEIDLESGFIQFAYTNDSTWCTFPIGVQNVSVTYTAGFATVPDIVQDACIKVALNMYAMASGNRNPAYKSEKIGDYSYTKFTKSDLGGSNNGVMSQEIKEMLEPYRLLYSGI